MFRSQKMSSETGAAESKSLLLTQDADQRFLGLDCLTCDKRNYDCHLHLPYKT